MWKLDQMAGFGLRGIPNDIFQSIEKFKFIVDGKIRKTNTLAVIKLVGLVIENGMKILGDWIFLQDVFHLGLLTLVFYWQNKMKSLHQY